MYLIIANNSIAIPTLSPAPTTIPLKSSYAKKVKIDDAINAKPITNPELHFSFLVTDNTDINIIAVFEFEELTMPIMSIELETSLNEVNQEDYVNAKMSISNTDEQYEFSNLDFLFRGRGNWSWDKEKKGYRIKFDSKQNLFGNCNSKHWAIIASYIDITLLRNKMSFEMVDVLDEIYYVTSCVNLEVYINGEYRGVYSLVELPKAEKDKMDIDESNTEIDTGYIIELDAYAIKDWQNAPTNAIEGIDYFKIDGVKYPFSVKTPDPDEYVDAQTHKKQVAYISDYFKKMFKAVFEHNFNEFTKYADVNSFVDMYILDEIIKSTDVGWQSFYFVKEKGGKVYVSMDEKLLFQSGRWVVDNKGANAIRELSKVLATTKDVDIVVEGPTDNVPFSGNGNIVDNWDLSVKRATSIVRILLENKDIDPAKVSASGRGEYCPVETADTKEARKANRRIEIILTPNLDELLKIFE